MSDRVACPVIPGSTAAKKNVPGPYREPPPFFRYPAPPMEMFEPERHLPRQSRFSGASSTATAPLPLYLAARLNPGVTLIPRKEDCHALWDQYAMLDNIRAHSTLVAEMAQAIGRRAREIGLNVSPEALLAAGLLHDLGKTYTIAHGGSHAQIGAAWVMRETRNGPIARTVMFHVHWPWQEDLLYEEEMLLPAIILYSDKRVKHDAYVGLDERFEDLLVRYGVNDDAKEKITASHMQGKHVESALSRRLEVELHEYTADSGRLVKRA